MESLGHYDLLSPIGQGGMAEVWLARRSMAGGPGKLVAIKRMSAGLASQEHYREMFEAETRMSMTLSHSNIVQVFDYGTEQGTAYIVMELVDGVDLGSLVAFAAQSEPGGILPLRVTAFVVGELLRALSYSHNLSISSARLGLIHRDVSPQNLLISKAGEVKLTDFGVARLVDENTSGAQPKGKLRYMAPEQMSGKGMDARVDLFAVGTILFELLTGRHYRDADSVDQLYGQILNAGPVELPEELPEELRSLTEDLLSPSVEDRIATAKEARTRLTAWEGYGDARDELAQLVRQCRPEALEIPPPRDRSSVGYSSNEPTSAAAFAGHTQAMPAPGRAAAQSGQTISNAVPEHTTLPDSTSTSGSLAGFAQARARNKTLAIAGAVAFVGGASLLMLSPSLRASVFGGGEGSDEKVQSTLDAGSKDSVAAAGLSSGKGASGKGAAGKGASGKGAAGKGAGQDGTKSPSKEGAAGLAKDRVPVPAAKVPGGFAAPGQASRANFKGPAGGASKQDAPNAGSIDSRDRTASGRSKDKAKGDRNESAREKRRRELRELRRRRAAEAREARKNEAQAPKAAETRKVSVVFKAYEFNYAYVKMAGKELLIEPLGKMTVPPGRHTVFVRESKSDPWRSFGSVQVKPGERAVLRLRRSGTVRVSRSTP